VRHGQAQPVDIASGGKPGQHRLELALGHLHRQRDHVHAALGHAVAQPVRRPRIDDRIAEQRVEPRAAV